MAGSRRASRCVRKLLHPSRFLEYGSYCTCCLLRSLLHLTKIIPFGGKVRGKNAPPAEILRYPKGGCGPPRNFAMPRRVVLRGARALVSSREAAVGDFATIVRWSYSGSPSPISTLLYASALLFLASELGQARSA